VTKRFALGFRSSLPGWVFVKLVGICAFLGKKKFLRSLLVGSNNPFEAFISKLRGFQAGIDLEVIDDKK
jgi:hypothetical protein